MYLPVFELGTPISAKAFLAVVGGVIATGEDSSRIALNHLQIVTAVALALSQQTPFLSQVEPIAQMTPGTHIAQIKRGSDW